MSYCPCCPQNETNFNNPLPSDNFHHQPSSTNAYHHAWYHYQSYLYYWNLCNAQNTHNIPLCECYEDARQSSNHYSSVYSNRCTDCTDGYRTNRDEGQFNTHRGPTSDVQFTDSNNYSEHQNQGDYNYDCDDNDDEEFEVDENFYHFLKQSQKHKEEREKCKFLPILLIKMLLYFLDCLSFSGYIYSKKRISKNR